MEIRPYVEQDADAVWEMLRPVFRAGDTYCIDPEISREAALEFWAGGNHSAFVAGDAGTYYICPNQAGGGAHVCNCGFVTGVPGKGVARAMLEHALAEAERRGYRAMQFNFVVETNARALDIWFRAGFAEVGRLPGAFHHPERGYVDALVLYKSLV
ncbi:GNAT family N-acetyltransferase [Algicella marina]|uniref:GNAT family N-acetyltransferase n=1 Tax=Algicella marina TaxID=2683284 RepID=A0A6P1T0A8_9RHOB|nr:GNAT family N-acetyltransferase [Algicella marina]QHQ36354.1 GNAT family N-acetyltransferase [Algicella marina]